MPSDMSVLLWMDTAAVGGFAEGEIHYELCCLVLLQQLQRKPETKFSVASKHAMLKLDNRLMRNMLHGSK